MVDIIGSMSQFFGGITTMQYFFIGLLVLVGVLMLLGWLLSGAKSGDILNFLWILQPETILGTALLTGLFFMVILSFITETKFIALLPFVRLLIIIAIMYVAYLGFGILEVAARSIGIATDAKHAASFKGIARPFLLAFMFIVVLLALTFVSLFLPNLISGSWANTVFANVQGVGKATASVLGFGGA